MTDTRSRVRRRVAADPGVHFNSLVRVLDLAPGQTQYHLRKLRRADDVVAEPLYGRTHYYPPEYDPWERRATAVLRRETARDALLLLLDNGPAPPSGIADELGVARSTLEWHLDHLVEQELVTKERDTRNRVTLVPVCPEASVRLLRAVEPSLPERLVDRFERLVDGLLAGTDGGEG